jgi:hypothetical protein
MVLGLLLLVLPVIVLHVVWVVLLPLLILLVVLVVIARVIGISLSWCGRVFSRSGSLCNCSDSWGGLHGSSKDAGAEISKQC